MRKAKPNRMIVGATGKGPSGAFPGEERQLRSEGPDAPAAWVSEPERLSEATIEQVSEGRRPRRPPSEISTSEARKETTRGATSPYALFSFSALFERQRENAIGIAAASGKKCGPTSHGPTTEPEGPAGGCGPAAILFPWSGGFPWAHSLERSGTVGPWWSAATSGERSEPFRTRRGRPEAGAVASQPRRSKRSGDLPL